MGLSEKVKKLREKKGWNQKELADASGLTPATISRVESHQVLSLKSPALIRLAGALGTTVDFLIDNTKSQTASDIVSSDPDAKVIFQGYEKLSAPGREQLKEFVRFLEQQEKKKRGEN